MYIIKCIYIYIYVTQYVRTRRCQQCPASAQRAA